MGCWMIKMYEIAMDVCENKYEEIQNTIRRIVELWYVGKEEGLWALEGYMYSCEDFDEKKFLRNAVTHVVDGIDWKDLESILSNRILVMENDKKKYLCLIYKEGIKVIQKGIWGSYGDACILSLIPDKYEEQVSMYLEKVMEHEAQEWYQKRVIDVTKKYQELEPTLQMLFAEEMKLFEEELQLLPNHIHTQAWLRQMEHLDVALLMMVGSNAFRESILSNMSSRLKIEVMDDVVQKTQKYKNKQLSEIRVDVREVMKRALEGDME